jgi:uncharacterized repeat protein (TIGR01451 family)
VTNTATIAVAGDGTLERKAFIWLIPQSTPTPILAGSHKTASRHVLGSGGTLVYTIKLINSGTADAVVDVTDPVPDKFTYVAGSATGGGVYSDTTRTLTWNDVAVPMRSEVSLSFAATAAAVTAPTVVTNTATIAMSGGSPFERSARVLLLPAPPSTDVIPPVVHSLTIDEQDVLTNRQVTLHLSATDNVTVTQMMFREWQLAPTPRPHWQVVTTTRWLPFQADYEWTLGPANGVHYVGVWVADAARNTSRLNRNALDFASLVLPEAHVAQGDFVPYLVYYDAGVHVQAALTTIHGTANLLVWEPGRFGLPDHTGALVRYDTTRPGVNTFVVLGETAATYDLSITPGGGQAAALSMLTAKADLDSPSGSMANPFVATGLEPLGDPTAPVDSPTLPPVLIYMPVVFGNP